MNGSRAAYDDSLARMTAAVQALPTRRRNQTFELVAAHLDTITAAIAAQPTRRRSPAGVVSSCRPVAANTPEGGRSQ